MKKLLVLFLCSLVFIACSGDNEEPEVPQVDQAPVTVWAYLIADNDLTNVLSDNVEAMFKGLSNMDKQATLLIYWDGGKKSSSLPNPCVLKFETDGCGKINNIPSRDSLFLISKIAEYAEVIKTYPQQLSTDKEVMLNVLNDMASASLTDDIVLIAGSHANGWLKGTANTRAFGDDSHKTMDIQDMAEVMSKVNKTFDLLLFDACLMGTVEVCYNFKDVVNYQLSSVMEIPAYGFPYHLMIDDLFEGTIEGYKQAGKSYVDFYKDEFTKGEYNVWGTISLVDNRKIQELTDAIKQQLHAKKEFLYNYDVSSLQEYGRGGTHKYLSFDLNQFVKEINNGVVPMDFQSCLLNAVLYLDCLEEANPSSHSVDLNNYSGLGIYIPISQRSTWNSYFKTLDWYTAAGWNEVTFSWEN